MRPEALHLFITASKQQCPVSSSVYIVLSYPPSLLGLDFILGNNAALLGENLIVMLFKINTITFHTCT